MILLPTHFPLPGFDLHTSICISPLSIFSISTFLKIGGLKNINTYDNKYNINQEFLCLCASKEYIFRVVGSLLVVLFPSCWLMTPPYSISRFKSSHMVPGHSKISFTWLPQTSMESDLKDEIWFLTASGPLGAHRHSSFSLYPSPFLSPS